MVAQACYCSRWMCVCPAKSFSNMFVDGPVPSKLVHVQNVLLVSTVLFDRIPHQSLIAFGVHACARAFACFKHISVCQSVSQSASQPASHSARQSAVRALVQ
eukprot:4403222-Alexandrium_andersonii.AAC.1